MERATLNCLVDRAVTAGHLWHTSGLKKFIAHMMTIINEIVFNKAYRHFIKMSVKIKSILHDWCIRYLYIKDLYAKKLNTITTRLDNNLFKKLNRQYKTSQTILKFITKQ